MQEHESDDPLMGQREQEIARKIFSNFAGFRPERFPEIRSLLRPSVLLSGDLLLVERSPDNGLRVMLGDFTGHGITAALGSILVAETFHQSAKSGVPMPQIIQQVNDRLYQKLPTGLFCASLFLSLERHERDRAVIWNCGLPPCLVVSRQQGGIIQKIRSSHLPLGLVSSQRLDLNPEVYFPQQGDHFYLYTDGLTEATNRHDEMVGQERMEEMVNTVAGFDTEEEQLDVPRYLAKFIDHFTGEVGQEDDISIVEILVGPKETLQHLHSEQLLERTMESQKLIWQLELLLGTEAIRWDEDPISVFVNQIADRMKQHRALGEKEKREIYMLLNESWSNALEHGLLGLDSSIRETAEGFEQYYREKEGRIEQLADHSIRITCGCYRSQEGDALWFRVGDSGQGFDGAAALQRIRQQGAGDAVVAHGRGLSMISSLCDWIDFEDDGRVIKMAYFLLEDDRASKDCEDPSVLGYFK